MALTLTTPDYFFKQRNPLTGKADLPVAGTGATPGSTVEARWNGGAWTEMTVELDGHFAGTLLDQSTGQGSLEVREDGGAVADTATNVSVCSVIVTAGASNMSGRGENYQSYSHATLKALNFKNNYQYAELVDPYDNYGGQIDTVSKDQNIDAAGSFAPLFATLFMAEYGYPLAFVPCPMGGITAEQWDDVGVDRNTLFGSMAYRLQQVGGAELCLFMTNGNNVPSFEASMRTFAEGIKQYGCQSLMIISGVLATGYTSANKHTTWQAHSRLAKEVPNIIPGAQLRRRVSDDSYHMITDEKLLYGAQEIFKSVKAWKDLNEGITTFRQKII